MRRIPLTILLAATLASACHREPPAAERQGNAVAPASPDKPDLSRYVGRYPGDLVGGTRFLDQPAVRQAVLGLVTDRAIATRILSPDATATPIARVDGLLVSYGCEPHNCGPHNWAVELRPDGSAPRVCYKPDGHAPRWFGDAPVGAAKDTCPSGDPNVPG